MVKAPKPPNVNKLSLVIARSAKTFRTVFAPEFGVEQCTIQEKPGPGSDFRGLILEFKLSDIDGNNSRRKVTFTADGELEFSWTKTGVSNQRELHSTIWALLVAMATWHEDEDGTKHLVEMMTFPVEENIRLEQYAPGVVAKTAEGDFQWRLGFGLR